MDILVEDFGLEKNLIAESVNDAQKSMYLSGIIAGAGERNRNGRIYPLNEMTNAVTDFNLRIKENNGILGEADHPADRLSVAIDRVSHLIMEVNMDGNFVRSKMKILETPLGLIVKEIIKAGYKPAVSTRGAGNVDGDGMVSNFVLNSVDIVTDPSCIAARPTAIYEAVEQASNSKKIISLSESIRHDDKAQKYFKKEIMKFLSELK